MKSHTETNKILALIDFQSVQLPKAHERYPERYNMVHLFLEPPLLTLQQSLHVPAPSNAQSTYEPSSRHPPFYNTKQPGIIPSQQDLKLLETLHGCLQNSVWVS